MNRHAAGSAVAGPRARESGRESAREPHESDALLLPTKAEVDALYADNTNIWRRDQALIPVFYLLLGFCISFPFVAQRQFLRNTLHVNPGGQGAVLGVIIQSPWFIKLVFAFLSDSVPICGLRRKPYCVFGVVTCGAAWVLLGVLPQKSAVLFCGLSAVATLGLVVADVMVDTLVVFIVREYEQLRADKLGSLQTTAWILRFVGSIVGMVSGGLLLEHGHVAYETVFWLTGGVFLVCLIPPLWLFREVQWKGGYSAKDQLLTIWEYVQDPVHYKMLFFLLFVGSLPSSGDAFTNFLLGPLHFSHDAYAYIGAAGIVFSGLGIGLYKLFLREAHLWLLLSVAILSLTSVQLLQLILVRQINVAVHIPDFVFAFGDEAVKDTFQFFILMPALIVSAKLSPPNVEGSMYALVTMTSNISGALSRVLGAAMLTWFNISLTDFSHLVPLIIVVSLITLAALVAIPLMPATVQEVQGVHTRRPSVGFGAAVLAAILGGLAFAVAYAVLKVAFLHSV